MRKGGRQVDQNRKPTDRTSPRGFESSRRQGGEKPGLTLPLDSFVVAEFATNHVKADQVHLLLQSSEIPDIPTPVRRFKSPDTLGFLIEELIVYRRSVWPDAPDPNFDAQVLPADSDE